MKTREQYTIIQHTKLKPTHNTTQNRKMEIREQYTITRHTKLKTAPQHTTVQNTQGKTRLHKRINTTEHNTKHTGDNKRKIHSIATH